MTGFGGCIWLVLRLIIVSSEDRRDRPLFENINYAAGVKGRQLLLDPHLHERPLIERQLHVVLLVELG